MAENLLEAHKLHLASDRRGPHAACCVGWPHLLHERDGQPVPPPRPHRRLLASPHPRGHGAQDLVLARRAVRHDPPRLLEIAARVSEMITRVKVSLPSSYPYEQDLARFAGRALALPP